MKSGGSAKPGKAGWTALFIVGIAQLAAVCSVDAQAVPAALRGIESIRVVVEPLNDDAAEMGLTTASLQTKAELELRASGIRVSNERDRRPFLYIAVSVIKTARGFAFHNTLALLEPVLPIRKLRTPSQVLDTLLQDESEFARVWNLSSIGTTSADGAANYVRELLVRDLEHFMNDFLAVNPR